MSWILEPLLLDGLAGARGKVLGGLGLCQCDRESWAGRQGSWVPGNGSDTRCHRRQVVIPLDGGFTGVPSEDSREGGQD